LIEIIFSSLSSLGSTASFFLSFALCLLCFLIAIRSAFSFSSSTTDYSFICLELFDFSSIVLLDLKVEVALLLTCKDYFLFAFKLTGDSKVFDLFFFIDFFFG